jgi:uncharacterized protein (TIGR02646 family)
MEKIERTDAPGWLIEKWEEWGKEWADKCNHKDNPTFSWRQHNKKGRKELGHKLSLMTQHHCSFCDAYPMGSRLKSTIEHFKPKIKFPLEAYKWENLFLACSLCQEKGDRYNNALLKPDVDGYSFDKYFDIDWTNGELIPNRDATDEEKERARMTITLYGLNKNGKPEDRLEELDKFQKGSDNHIDIYPYRFFLKRGCLTD